MLLQREDMNGHGPIAEEPLDKSVKGEDIRTQPQGITAVMTDIHDQEMGHFVDSLSPHQRVYLQRVLGEFLTVVPRRGQDNELDPAILDLVQQSSTGLFLMLETLRRFEANDADSDIRPFALSFPEPGHGLLTLSTRIHNWRGLWDPRSHDWLDEVPIGRLTINLRKLEEINSSTIAWLVMLAGRLPDRRLYVAEVSDRIRRSIDVLKLGEVLVVLRPSKAG